VLEQQFNDLRRTDDFSAGAGDSGAYFIRDGEQIFEEAASAEKEFLVVEGMNHNLGNCTACATFHGTGPYTNIPLNLWNYVAAWADAHIGN
jgi:hypothetical protein